MGTGHPEPKDTINMITFARHMYFYSLSSASTNLIAKNDRQKKKKKSKTKKKASASPLNSFPRTSWRQEQTRPMTAAAQHGSSGCCLKTPRPHGRSIRSRSAWGPLFLFVVFCFCVFFFFAFFCFRARSDSVFWGIVVSTMRTAR
jgi:hypothetical protein